MDNDEKVAILDINPDDIVDMLATFSKACDLFADAANKASDLAMAAIDDIANINEDITKKH